MARLVRSLAAAVAVLSLASGVVADCQSYGIDYANGGSYYIDGGSTDQFTFLSTFSGCNDENISPVLQDPNGKQYSCSAVRTTPDGAQSVSTCSIRYSDMWSGDWKIIVSSRQIGVQRTFSLTVGVPERVTVTATKTIIVGVTSTPPAKTVFTTVSSTAVVILAPQTVQTPCTSPARTVTTSPAPVTEFSTSIVTRTTVGGVVTKYTTVTETKTASCRLGANPTGPPTFCIGTDCPFPTWGLVADAAPTPAAKAAAAAADGLAKVAGVAAVAATTVTYTQTTYTATITSTTIAPTPTKTEASVRTITSYSTPPPTTICRGAVQPGPTITVTEGRPTTITRTTTQFSTTGVYDTVWVGTTSYSTYSNPVSASACWRLGGRYE